jgi:hypothetical protein
MPPKTARLVVASLKRAGSLANNTSAIPAKKAETATEAEAVLHAYVVIKSETGPYVDDKWKIEGVYETAKDSNNMILDHSKEQGDLSHSAMKDAVDDGRLWWKVLCGEGEKSEAWTKKREFKKESRIIEKKWRKAVQEQMV